MTTWHVYMPIAAAERMSDDQLEDAFSGTAAEIRTSLAIMKANGMEVIPSKGCDNRDSTGHCLGHETMTYQAYADHHITPRRVPLCEACNGHGLIGGLLPAGGGYESETCGECGGTGSCYPDDLLESDGGEP